MDQPASFREDRIEVMQALIRAHPLGTLVTAGRRGLAANLVPFTLAAEGVLRAHLARANGQLDDLRDGAETLVIFQGPHAYVSPSWYVSKREHGRVVPTWNYIVVQARGVPRVIDDPAWLHEQVTRLTAQQERGRPEPWQVGDAPEPFIAGQLKGIVGVELRAVRLEGKWKVSQNRPEPDRLGVAAAIERDRGDRELARLVRERGAARGG
jgi:transcriptional regulator